MSLLFFDGFDGYDAASDLANFGSWAYSAGGSILTTVRTGTGKCLHLAGDVSDAGVKVLPAEQAGKTLFIGFAHRLTTRANNCTRFFYVADSAGSMQVGLRMSDSLLLTVVNSAGTVLATGTFQFQFNTWYYIEVKVLVANSGGIFDCKVEGVTDITFSGDTQSAATNAVDRISFGSYAIYHDTDDVYICNSDGSINNTYLGEVLCKHLPLIGDTTAGFTRNTGASNYLAVDDLIGSPDDATTYVSATTTGTRDEYTLTNTSGTNAIFGVKVNTRAQKDSVNAKSFKHGIKTGANQQDATVALGIGYSNYQNIYESSDGAGTAWTPTTLDAAVSTIEVV